MALGETARLIASLELQDKFSRTANTAAASIDTLERKTSTLGRVGTQVGQGLGAAARNLQTIGVIGAGLIAANVTAGIRSIARLEEVTAATNAVLESTNSIAGISADRIRALAEEYEGLNATIDDKVIQSAENLLLTFTNIRKEAFEPALEAALNMNQALGGGEEGLQGTVIQLGKALQDPIKGITALRRVGVNFTEEQRKQIKTLVEQNDLFGAQQIILQELGTEFGGQFAAAGATATGKFAKLKDAIEDAQVALATAFLPVLGKVADKLQTFLADPKVIAQIEAFGEGLAGGLDQVIEFAGKVPWETIGTSLQIAGSGAKILLDAFVSLPPWIQTAVITGWGLNKLTGGALGNIVGTLASGLIKGVLGINAGVVHVNAATVNAGGAGGAAAAGARGGLLGTAAKFVLGPLAAVIIGAEIAAVINEKVIGPTAEREERQVEAVIASGDINRIGQAIEAVEAERNTDDILAQTALIASNIPFIGAALGDVGPKLDAQEQLLRDQFQASLDDAHTNEEALRAAQATTDRLTALAAHERELARNIEAAGRATVGALRSEIPALRRSQEASAARVVSTAARTAAAVDAARSAIGRGFTELGGVVRASKTAVKVSVNVTSSISISDTLRRITSARVATGTISEF